MRCLSSKSFHGLMPGMIDYERAVAKKKRKLFQDLFGLLPKSGPVVDHTLLEKMLLFCYTLLYFALFCFILLYFALPRSGKQCPLPYVILFMIMSSLSHELPLCVAFRRYGRNHHLSRGTSKSPNICQLVFWQWEWMYASDQTRNLVILTKCIRIELHYIGVSVSAWVSQQLVKTRQNLQNFAAQFIAHPFGCRCWRWASEVSPTLCTWVPRRHLKIWISSAWTPTNLCSWIVLCCFFDDPKVAWLHTIAINCCWWKWGIHEAICTGECTKSWHHESRASELSSTGSGNCGVTACRRSSCGCSGMIASKNIHNFYQFLTLNSWKCEPLLRAGLTPWRIHYEVDLAVGFCQGVRWF